MGSVVAEITMSLDGFVTAPNDDVGRGLGEGGEPLHNWVMGGSWTYDDEGDDSLAATGTDRQVLDEAFASSLLGAGRPLFAHLGAAPIRLEVTRVLESPLATHLRYRIAGREA